MSEIKDTYIKDSNAAKEYLGEVKDLEKTVETIVRKICQIKTVIAGLKKEN